MTVPNSHAIPGVGKASVFLNEALDRAAQVKETGSIEPALTKADLGDVSAQAAALFNDILGPVPDDSKTKEQRRLRQVAMIETAARDIFSQLIATTPIESPKFVKVWNLFDLISILSDDEQCDASLLFWLVEELLESQTIAGCRRILDYLESRRERITARHFRHKQLVILRSCNELLRRLSRAEDTSFCGRVFIFMFQSFPLGDRSSVNPRGEYHVENVTTYDQPTGDKNGENANGDAMEVDSGAAAAAAAAAEQQKADGKAVSFNTKRPAPNGKPQPIDMDTFYPMFWSLQESFSQPKKLFDQTHFARFKTAMEATMNQFKTIEIEPRGSKLNASSEETKRSLKRKREDEDDNSLANGFNPKYLTSRDLFELEISDLSFRRHILVQALIIMDFLLSLSDKAKEKLNAADLKTQNRSVLYSDQHLSEEDTKWATEMKNIISHYLRLGMEGPYFLRMVETVLSRDKNWVRWKIESCPPIKRDPVPPEQFNEARATARRNTTNKRLRRTTMGSLALDFLEQQNYEAAMDRFKDRQRYELPALDTFRRKIADDDFEIEMPTNAETKAAAMESKASKSWRALRIAGQLRLESFDRIDEPDKIDAVFEEKKDPDEAEDEPIAAADDMPSDKRLVVLSGPTAVGKTALADKLMENLPGVFKRVVRHTTKAPAEGETAARSDVQLVTAEAFNVMVNNDQFLEFGKRDDGVEYGTTRRNVEAVAEQGRVPLVEVSRDSVQQIRDMAFDARFVLVQAPSVQVLEERLRSAGVADEGVKEVLRTAGQEMKVDGFDKVVVNDGVEDAVEALRAYIYGENEQVKETGEKKKKDEDAVINGAAETGAGKTTEGDVAMVDATAAPPEAPAETEAETQKKVDEEKKPEAEPVKE